MDAIFSDVGNWLAALGPWAYLAAPAVMTAVAILPIPAEAPAMANGMLFGVVMGSAITWSGALLGAWLSFEMARVWGRPLAGRMMPATAFERVDGFVEGVGWGGLLAARLVPVISFTALNWGAGLCKVPRARFLWTTAFGIAPGVILFTSSGVGLGALYRRSPMLTLAIVLAATAALGMWAYARGHRRART